MHPTERLNMYRAWTDWLASLSATVEAPASSSDEDPPPPPPISIPDDISTPDDLDAGHRVGSVCGLRRFERYVVDHFDLVESNMRNRNLLRNMPEMPSVVVEVDVPVSPAGDDNETPSHYCCMPIVFTVVAILFILVPIIAYRCQCIIRRRSLLQDISGPLSDEYTGEHPRVVITMLALPCGLEKGGVDAMSDGLCSDDCTTDTSDCTTEDEAAEEMLRDIESWPDAVSAALFSAIERQKELQLTFDELSDLGDKTDSDTDSDRLRRIVAIVVRKPASVSKLMLDLLRDAKLHA